MEFNKDNFFAVVGTIIIHLILFIILYYAIIKTIVPGDDGGIPVNFGYIAIASGTFEPRPAVTQPKTEVPPQPSAKPVVAKEKELITQNKEETVSIPAKKEKEKEKKKETVVDTNAKKAQEEADRKLKEDAERKRIEEDRIKKAENIDNLASNAFGKGSSQENNQGDATTGTGNQGSPFGNSSSGANDGIGGPSGSFNLGGRSIIGVGGLPRPEDNVREEGRIVINITVDPNGNVIFADLGRGTNIDNNTMRKSAIAAAKRAKFNKIKGANNENGTITYNYKLN
jgi:TonB family C-terminal domain